MSSGNSAWFGHHGPAEALPSSCQASPDGLSAVGNLLGNAGWCFIRCSTLTESRRREAAGEVVGKPVEHDLSFWAPPRILALLTYIKEGEDPALNLTGIPFKAMKA